MAATVRRARQITAEDVDAVGTVDASMRDAPAAFEDNDESRDPLEDSGCTRSADSEEGDDDDIEDSVAEDMRQLEESFRGFGKRFHLINRIGEGTFSTVYKAEDLEYERYRNEWDLEAKENFIRSPSGRKMKRPRRQEHFVAVKKIYVTSSPQRIMNELELLHDLRNCDTIAPLITAFRDKDQVIAILPYFRHMDFRAYYREFNTLDMRHYFRSLLRALDFVHKKKIIHRDVKPTNFLYNPARKQGVLIDFGLAEREGTDHQPCVCELHTRDWESRVNQSYFNTHEKFEGYPKGDQRPSLRANRAGTRGFRAPEVLFKCTAQTTKLDVWSAGIIMLTILCKRFPFFNSSDDVDAIIELATIFGRSKMRACSLTHGRIFETNIPTISDKGFTLENIIIWSLDRPTKTKDGQRTRLPPDEKLAVEFMETMLILDPKSRATAASALTHDFLQDQSGGSEDEMDVLCMSSQN